MSERNLGGRQVTTLALAAGVASWAGAASLAGVGLSLIGDPSRGAIAWLHAAAGGELLLASLLAPCSLVRREGPRDAGRLRLDSRPLAMIGALAAGAVLRGAVLVADQRQWPAAAASWLVTLSLAILAAAAVRAAAGRSSDPAVVAGAPTTALLLLALAPFLVAPLRAAPSGGALLQVAAGASPVIAMSSALGLDLFHLEAVYRLLGLGAVRWDTPAWGWPALGYLAAAGIAIVLTAPRRSERPAPEGRSR